MAAASNFTGLLAGLRRVSADLAPNAARFTAGVDPAFGQGRTVFGGAGAALAYRGIESTLAAAAEAAGNGAVEKPLPLRSLMCSFAGPIAPGDLECRAEVLRAGKNLTSAEAKLYQGDGCKLALIASLGDKLNATPSVAAETASEAGVELPDREQMKTIPKPSKSFPVPTFLGQFEIKWHTGTPFPVDPPNARRTAMWLRHEDRGFLASNPAAALIAIADMPPPVILLHYDRMAPVSSVTWFLDFVDDPTALAAHSPDGWFFLDYRLDSAKDGYSQQSGRIYAEDGRLVAYSRQSMVYYDPKPAAKGKL